MAINFNPGLKAAGIDPSMVDKLIEVEKLPIQSAEKRKQKVQAEKQEYDKLDGLLNELDSSLKSLKTKQDFYKFKIDSSHPDIIDGSITGNAFIGSYEFEVRSLARNEKELAYGFPDKDESPVGFGFMLIEKENGEEVEIEVEPNTTLSKLASQINDADAGLKAMVINTKFEPDPYRLIVISEDSGNQSKIHIDEDTTFLEFKEQVTGSNINILFEDVPITDEDNILDDLIDGITLNVRRSEPGTRVQINVVHSTEDTIESIKDFVTKYNAIASFINGQFSENSEGGYGVLSGDSSIKFIMRQMQSAILSLPQEGRKFNTIADIGISTNPKTGQLEINETKVKEALTEDYDSVAQLFVRTKSSLGVAESLAQKLRTFRDPGFGAVKSKMRALDRIIEGHDKEIERRERQLETKEASIRRRFTALESTLANLKGQSDFLKSRFGGGGGKAN